MSAWQAGLALLSAIVGGGIVGIPYAMYQTGITLGLILNILVALTTVYSGNLYLKCKEMAPMYVESLYELSYVVMKRTGIFFLAAVVLVSGIGCIMIYFIVFGDISASLAQKVYGGDTDNILTKRPIYVVGLSLLMLPLCLKK